MISRFGMAARAPRLDHRAFQAHWASSHADAVLGLPGLRAYVQLPAVLGDDGEPLLSEWGYDAISRLDFDDPAAMDAAFASDAYRGAVSADEARFIDKSAFAFGVYDATTVGGGGDAPVWLLLGWPDAPEDVAADGSHVRYAVRPHPAAPFTRVDVLGFDAADVARAAAEGWPAARRHLARPHTVV